MMDSTGKSLHQGDIVRWNRRDEEYVVLGPSYSMGGYAVVRSTRGVQWYAPETQLDLVRHGGESVVAVKETERGFEFVCWHDANGDSCSLQQSSAVGDFPDALDKPGSSRVWLGRNGRRMHLTREHALWLAELLTRWAKTGSFKEAP